MKSVKEKVKPNTTSLTSVNYPKIGLALGGGGALGLAHLGVLKALETSGVIISKIVGTSMGAIVGAGYSTGTSLSELYKMAKEIKTVNLIDFDVRGRGFLSGKRAEKILSKYINENLEMSDLNYDFSCNAVDLYSGQEVHLTKGNVLKNVRASFSVPGVFAPVEIDDKYLIDGGLINNVPDNYLTDANCDIIIAVDVVNDYPKVDKIKYVKDVLYYSLVLYQATLSKSASRCADFTIKPKVEKYRMYLFNKKYTTELINAGRAAAMEIMPEILNKIDEFKRKQK